jgi:hypothetical protein
MNNEIGRKITSLTLMTIMLAGGMVIAAPSMMPVAHAANANLFVSAENSQFSNYMSGPQVIEVVVIDSDINETNESNGEPDVTINGAKLRMAQATDGNWYGYFADKTQAQRADGTTETTDGGFGLDFGQFCGPTSVKLAADETEALFSDSVGVSLPIRTNSTGGAFGTNGTATIAQCTGDFDGKADRLSTHQIQNATHSITVLADTTGFYAEAIEASIEQRVMNVVREAKTINSNSATGNGIGQIGLKDDGLWPFIQLYDFTTGGNVNIQYAKGGGVQSTSLTFDTMSGVAWSLDRNVYPQGADLHLTISDAWLNIDPTDEDSWTFGTSSSAYETIYQMFDENGATRASASPNAIDLQSTAITGGASANQLSNLMGADVVLKVDANVQGTGNVLLIQDNANNVVTSGGDIATAVSGTLAAATQPVTITETSTSSGVFVTFDESDKSTLATTSTAKRGTSATISYDGSSASAVIGHDFATLSMNLGDDEWNSGEEISIVLIDGDSNKNSLVNEDLTLSDPTKLIIPSLVTGDPFTIGEASNSTLIVYANFSGSTASLLGESISGTTSDEEAGQLNNQGSAESVHVNATIPTTTSSIDSFSERAIVNAGAGQESINAIVIDFQTTMGELRKSISDTSSTASPRLHGFNYLNLDVRSFNDTGKFDVWLLNHTTDIIISGAIQHKIGTMLIAEDVDAQSLTSLNDTASGTLVSNLFDTTKAPDANNVGVMIVHHTTLNTLDTTNVIADADDNDPIVVDFFSYGFTNDGYLASERVNNQIIRLELEESGDNTSSFEGTLEYIMVNQLNILNSNTYNGTATISDSPIFIVMEDLSEEDAPRVNYLDLGTDGVSTQIADQLGAPSHSGIVSLNMDNYKEADTVIVTLEDLDLNTDSSLIDIYTVLTTEGDTNDDTIGHGNSTTTTNGPSITLSDSTELGRLLDITFDDERWTDNTCTGWTSGVNKDLGATGFTLVETGTATGIFIGDFQIPSEWCSSSATTPGTVTGKDIEVNYVDFRDASGATIEVGDGAGIRANTGSVSLDRTVYPVPFGVEGDFASQSTTATPNGRALFPIHQSSTGTDGLQTGEYIANGDLTIHVRVNDPDFDLSATGEDKIGTNSTAGSATGDNNLGPVKISVIRGSSSIIIGHAGGPAALDGLIAVGTWEEQAPQFGPMYEIAPDAGIYESDITIRYTDGPSSSKCPSTTVFTGLNGTSVGSELVRFDTAASDNYCILQGDILQVEYTDPADASGSVNTVTDSATFDLRNGVLQSDKSVYIIGSDMILTLIEPDFDLDNDSAETYDLDLIEWDDGDSNDSMGDQGAFASSFDPEPSDFRETGDSTGIFQIVVEIPSTLGSNDLNRGQQIDLQYTDWGPSGSDYVGDEDEDIDVTVFTSNFGATVELDQKVYTWTDKVYITIVAPDHNFDGGLIDSIGENTGDIIKVSTRSAALKQYKLVETGTDTGIFTGEVILTGFQHDADGDSTTGTSGNDVDDESAAPATSGGPTDGRIPTKSDDGLTVSFEYTEDQTVVGSALIRWNIGETQWLEASYPASGTGVVRIIDPDMNWDPEAVDNFNIDLWSDSDAGGIDLTVTETNEATGIFEGTVFFTTTDESSGHRLRVSEGDTVTAEYEDNTLPSPYTTADELDVTSTTLIGTVVPPLERAPAANLRTVDAFGNSLDAVSVDQQVQLTADLSNGQDKEQAFAYLVQVQNSDGVTVSLAWITGSLTGGQSFSPALSWIPTEAGTYSVTAFVWESIDNPTALSPSVSTTVNVR